MARLLVRRLHAGLSTKRAARGNGASTDLFRQGSVDRACGIYCLVMALVLLGEVSREQAERTLGSRQAVLRRFRLWTADVYTEGMSEDDLVETVGATTLNVSTRRSEAGEHLRCLAHALRGLRAGHVVAIGIAARGNAFHHWVLGVGTEGMEIRRRYVPQAILALDPSSEPWPQCGYNARLFLKIPRFRARFLRYSSSETPYTRVTVTSAVVLSKRRRHGHG